MIQVKALSIDAASCRLQVYLLDAESRYLEVTIDPNSTTKWHVPEGRLFFGSRGLLSVIVNRKGEIVWFTVVGGECLPIEGKTLDFQE